jgi:endogenous inhibitor of DNA gyrase (YacG/DUF329 family)
MSSKSHHSPCLQCGKEVVQTFKPFCSERCKQLDLHGWLAGKYVISSASAEKETRPSQEDSAQEAEDD